MLNQRTIKEFSIITAGTVIIASAVFFFLIPSQVSVGSASALAMVISNFVPWPVSVITFAINMILLVIGFLLLGHAFGLKTVYASVLLPAVMRVYELIFPNFHSLTMEPMLDVLCYTLVAGIGLALLFSCDASSGGLDIVAKLMNRYLHMDLGQAMSVSGMMVALSSTFCYDKKTVVLSVLGTYFGGIVVDHFIFGLNIKRRVCIISPKADEIIRFIVDDMGSNASIYTATGAYDGISRREIIAIVDNQEYKQLMRFMKQRIPMRLLPFILSAMCPKKHNVSGGRKASGFHF